MRRAIAIVALVLLVGASVVPVASAAQGGMDRPVRGAFTGVVMFEFDWSDPECPVTTLSDTWGTMGHLGLVHASWSHCPPVAVPGYRDGVVTFTAANGDRIYGTYEDADEESPFTIQLYGGTGRFEEAVGSIEWSFQAFGEWGPDGLPINPWTIEATLSGTLGY